MPSAPRLIRMCHSELPASTRQTFRDSLKPPSPQCHSYPPMAGDASDAAAPGHRSVLKPWSGSLAAYENFVRSRYSIVSWTMVSVSLGLPDGNGRCGRSSRWATSFFSCTRTSRSVRISSFSRHQIRTICTMARRPQTEQVCASHVWHHVRGGRRALVFRTRL